MKSILLSLSVALLFVSCSKKDNVEPDGLDQTNELVGTTWQRSLNPNMYNYLEFKTAKEVEFSSKYNGEPSAPLVSPYTLRERNLVYTIAGYNCTGTISGDTLAVMGSAGFLMIYVKIK